MREIHDDFFRLPPTRAYDFDSKFGSDALRRDDHNVLALERLETLQGSFGELAEKFRTFRPLLFEIKREYDLVIAALLNITAEKTYLRSKVQSLICEVGSEQQLDQLRSTLVQLTYRNTMVEAENEELKQTQEEDEVAFLLNLARVCAPATPKGPEDKQRSMIRLKERWDRVERWINDRAHEEPLLKSLGERLTSNPERYQSVVDRDALTEMVFPDSHQEAKQAEQHALKEQLESEQKQLRDIQAQRKAINAELAELNEKIENLEVLTDLARSRLAVSKPPSI
ncbi:hypothetical protein BDZ88DRAFT_402173 [Geranomyces variabilis]|nr:hypothetical protein BDZ88DRAFT_402173 [Geranomyces variabilis]